MDAKTQPHLEALKAGLQTLKDSGTDGFEGLLAAVLSEVCGQPFRVASSGSQRGRDGDSAFDEGATYFEAKLYEDSVPQAAVSGKIVDLANDDKGQVDTWILCATSPVSSQHADKYRGSLAAIGIGCLILDWPPGTLPLLAVLLAMAAPRVERFVQDHSQDPSAITSLRADLDAVATDSQFAGMSTSLRSMVRDGSVGLGLAKAANQSALVKAFSDRREARRLFGQPLAPMDKSGLAWAERPALVQRIQTSISGVPDDRVVLVLGDEGTGKSWLVAKGWSTSQPAPLLAAFMASDLSMPEAMSNLEELLITKLSSQTGEVVTDAIRKRWKRRFAGWRANPAPKHIRLVVWVDGLNQAHSFPWPRWIDAMAGFLEEIGGRLIVTTNNWHYSQIRWTVTTPFDRVIVADWSEGELKSILEAKGIKSDVLAAEVFGFLRNPRILGIAVELLDAKEIERVDELTVGRLLFEHLRRHDADPANASSARDFAKTLKSHAEEMIERLKSQNHDDLTIFELGKELNAVSRSRFFEPVEGESDLYAIRREGLPLALGLALTSVLRKELRAGRDPEAKLAEVMEPISALSETSAVVFAALQISFLQEGCPAEVQAALAKYFVGLQNVSDDLYPAFEAMAKRSPEPFLRATHDAAFSRVRLPNVRWLILALLSASADPKHAAQIARQAQEWLCRHTLAPEVGMFRHSDRDAAKEAAELERLRQELETRRSALSEPEREFLRERLQEDARKGLPQLHSYALELLAGKPLEAAVPALIGWAFATALNPDFDSPDKHFRHLMRFNAVDWLRMRDAVRIACEPFLATEASNTAKRATVTMLSATGDPDDAARAHAVFEALDPHRPRFSWHDPHYSTADPCDPTTHAPANIDAIVTVSRNVDVAELSTSRGMTAQDHMVTRSTPALARFEPATAIKLRRAFARQALERTDVLSLRQAMIALLKDSAILEPDTVTRLISIGSAPLASEFLTDKGRIRDEWLVQQYALRAAFPHQSGDQQLRALEAGGGNEALLDLLEATSPASEAEMNAALDRALTSHDSDRLAMVVSFAQFSRSPLSSAAKSRLVPLLSSADRGMRMRALALAARSRDPGFLRQFLATGWDAADCDAKNGHREVWYGSRCLLVAADLGLIGAAEAVGRMGPNFYGFAAQLSDEGAKAVADRVDVAFHRAIGVNDIPQFPLVQQPLTATEGQEPPLLSLVDQPARDIQQAFEILGESDDAFQQRQKRSWQAFDRFVERITLADARIILDDFSWGGFDAIVTRNPALANGWKRSLFAVQDGVFRALHAFATGLARAIAPTDPAGSAKLFARTAELRPFVNRVIGVSSIPAEAVAAWSRASIPEVCKLCFARLDGAANDSLIAAEVLAAHEAGAQAFIQEYVDERLAIQEPAKTARALLVCGFSDLNDHATRTLQRFEGSEGFIGQAQQAATYAYRRNEWARHWYREMKAATSPEEFWSCAVLFAKIVDGRFDLWNAECGSPGEIFARFMTTIDDGVESRIKKWQSKRQSKLFGGDIPDPIFTYGQGGL
ncbi:hypothetical protein ABIA00_008036 [Bradyrhizobium ottawaense]|uniref:hypothetical protein n=1 Tax=Bradyrhizobium ottawaense TaxID=931866 RepID=UPI00383605C1